MMSSILLYATRLIRFWPVATKTILLDSFRSATRQVANLLAPKGKAKLKHSRIRSLTFIGHVLGMGDENASLLTYMGVGESPTLVAVQNWINRTAPKIVEHLLNRAPPLHLFSHRLMSWNITSLADLSSPVNKKKIRLIKMHLEKGPVFLQETK